MIGNDTPIRSRELEQLIGPNISVGTKRVQKYNWYALAKTLVIHIDAVAVNVGHDLVLVAVIDRMECFRRKNAICFALQRQHKPLLSGNSNTLLGPPPEYALFTVE